MTNYHHLSANNYAFIFRHLSKAIDYFVKAPGEFLSRSLMFVLKREISDAYLADVAVFRHELNPQQKEQLDAIINELNSFFPHDRIPRFNPETEREAVQLREAIMIDAQTRLNRGLDQIEEQELNAESGTDSEEEAIVNSKPLR